MSTVFDLIAGAGIVQGIFVAAFLLVGKRGAVPGNKTLAFLLIALALSTAHPFFGYLLGPARSRAFLIDPMQTLVNPFIWLFVSARASGRRFRPADLLHFAPFALVCAFLMLSPVSVPAMPVSIAYWSFAIAQAFAYFVPSVRAINAYSKALEESYSSIDSFRLEGLHAFMLTILILLAGRLSGLAILAHSESVSHADRLMELLQAFAVYFLGMFIAMRKEPDVSPEAAGPKYGKNALTSAEAAVEYQKLEALVSERKVHLDPGLTLPGLARAAGMNRNDLSRIINEGGGSSFYDFINRHRIEEFKALARDPSKRSWKILALAYEAGFNSKPAFNSAFKRSCGTTPSAWMASIRRE